MSTGSVNTLYAALMLGVVASNVAISQTYPVKPLRVVVPYEPGGAIDLATRDIAPKASEELGQPFVIENRGGAGGQIGALQVARAAPDGYTFMFTVGTTHALSKFSTRNLPYDPVKDFTPIIAPAETLLSIAASAAFAPNSLSESLLRFYIRFLGNSDVFRQVAFQHFHIALGRGADWRQADRC